MNKLDTFIIRKKNQFLTHRDSLLAKKGKGDETLIVKIMLIAIVIALLVIFRNTISDIMASAMSKAQTIIENEMSNY